MISDSESLLDRINKLIDADRVALPVFGRIALQLRQIVAQPYHDAAEVERLIASDQALAADLLRAANSAFYGGLATIRTIRNAVIRLGTKQVTHLVCLASEHANYRARDPQLLPLVQRLWRHSSSTAMAAQWLAKRLRLDEIEDECFLGGLLHDIGQLLVLRAIDELKETDGQNLMLTPAVIKEVLDAAHTQLGYNLLRRWNLPEIYCRIAQQHHSEEFDSADLPLVIVRLANEASNKLGYGLNPDPSLVLSATPEAQCLKAGEVLLAELEIMLEDELEQSA